MRKIAPTPSNREKLRGSVVPAALGAALVVTAWAGLGEGAAQSIAQDRVPVVLARQGYFFVAGQYVGANDGQIMADQMYVEYQIPLVLTQPYPIVMIHGAGQTGTNFEGTPDNLIGAPNYFSDGALSRPWGITYTPPVNESSQLQFTQQATPDSPNLVRCRLQTGAVHQLSTLQHVPILMITSEASYHASYDNCMSEYLTQAGVEHTYVRLPDAGIHGNGHMMMLEKDNLQIAGLIEQWTS